MSKKKGTEYRNYPAGYLKGWREFSRAPLKALAKTGPVRVLHLKNEYLEGRAKIQKVDGVWKLIDCDPSLSFMKETPLDKWPLEIARRGFEKHWEPI